MSSDIYELKLNLSQSPPVHKYTKIYFSFKVLLKISDWSISTRESVFFNKTRGYKVQHAVCFDTL